MDDAVPEAHPFERLIKALAECVDANDNLHTVIADDSESNPNIRHDFAAAQRRETRAIEDARSLLVEMIGNKSTAAGKDRQDGHASPGASERALRKPVVRAVAPAGTQAPPVDTQSRSPKGRNTAPPKAKKAASGGLSAKRPPAPPELLTQAEANAAHLAPKKRGRPKGTTDRKEYQRNLMRQRRAAKKGTAK
jgi:hypothetical protein